MHAHLTGVVGQIRWAYYIAAAINGYAVTREKDNKLRWRLRGNVVMHDRFKLAQRPLRFVAPYVAQVPGPGGKTVDRPASWAWPILEFDIHQGVITAVLGPLER